MSAPDVGTSENAVTTINVRCSLTRDFDVRFAADLSRGDDSAIEATIDAKRVLLVTSPRVNRFYGEQVSGAIRRRGIELAVHVMRLGERRKTLDTVRRICDAATRHGLDRQGVIVALGGGVCLDVVTLAASLYRRGIKHIRMPTTVVGQVDAGIGLKGAVNFCGRKNLIGCFHPPAAVLIDPAFLATLSGAQIRHGLAEILKMALVADHALFGVLQRIGRQLIHSRFQDPASASRQVLERSIESMLHQLGQNPYEDQTFERLVDMGHTFSPALEAASSFRIPHGDAVAVDMALTCTVAETLGFMKSGDAKAFVQLLEELGLPVSSPLLTAELCRDAIASAISHRGGRLNLVIPTGIGHATFLGADALSDGYVLDTALERLRSGGNHPRGRRARGRVGAETQGA